MGSAGADWLTRPERIQEEEPDRMLASLGIKKGSVVADVGAGVGYHVGALLILSALQAESLPKTFRKACFNCSRKNINDRKVRNVEVVLGSPADPSCPPIPSTWF